MLPSSHFENPIIVIVSRRLSYIVIPLRIYNYLETSVH